MDSIQESLNKILLKYGYVGKKLSVQECVNKWRKYLKGE